MLCGNLDGGRVWRRVDTMYMYGWVPLLSTGNYRNIVNWLWKWKLLSCVNSLWLHGRWNSPGQNTGVGSLSLLQGIFPTQGSNPGLPHCGWILYQLSYKGSPRILEWVAYPFSSRSSWPRNWTRISCIAGKFFANWPMRESPKLTIHQYKIKSLIIKRKRIVRVREGFKDALLLALMRKEGTMNTGMKSSLRIWKRNQSCHQQCLQFSETNFGLLASRIIRK